MTRSDGAPLLAEEHLRQLIKVDELRLSTSSRRTALIKQHVNSARYVLTILPLLLLYKDYAKSTPTLLKGGASLTLNFGRGTVAGVSCGFLSNLRHTKQLSISFLHIDGLVLTKILTSFLPVYF